MTRPTVRSGSYGALIWMLLASSVAMLASTNSVVPPPENYQFSEYAWIKEDGRGPEYWWQHNNTGWNKLNLTYRFSRCNIAYVARSSSTAGNFDVTFIVFHNSSALSGFNASGHLYPGSQPNWTLTVPAQYQQTAGQHTYHLFITTFDPQGIPGIYQVRLNETGPGSGTDWNSPAGNPSVQWMFFEVPTAEPTVELDDQLGRAQPFFVDGISPSTLLNATILIDPPGNDTGAVSARVEWLDPSGSAIMTRMTPLYYVPGSCWAATDAVSLNSTAFPANGTHPYSVRFTVGYFVGSAAFRVLSTQWVSTSLDVWPIHGQWYDPSSFKVTYAAVIDTGIPSNPYSAVDNLTVQFWNASSMVGMLANLSWNITGYPVIPGSSYSYTWTGTVPASWIDASNGSREFFGNYTIRAVPTPGAYPAVTAETTFYVDDPIEAYTSTERASLGRSAFKAGSTIWINVELDPTYLRSRQHSNQEFSSKSVEIIWYWIDPPPDFIKKETVLATTDAPRPSEGYWAFSTINTSITDPDGIYAIGASIECDSGYRVYEYKYYDIYQSYTPPTESPNVAPYSGILTIPKSDTLWHTQPTQVKIYAADPLPGTGVDAIYYQIDNSPVQTGTHPTTTYFAAPEGSHMYTYWAVDRAGNAEVPKTVTIHVDTRNPETMISLVQGSGPYEGLSIIKLLAQDATPGSGVNQTFYAIDSSDPAPYLPDGFVALEGEHLYSYWSTDRAGNVETAKQSTIVVVLEPLPGLAIILITRMAIRASRRKAGS